MASMPPRCGPYQMPKEFRLLFATIIGENSPSSPFTLYHTAKFDLASGTNEKI